MKATNIPRSYRLHQRHTEETHRKIKRLAKVFDCTETEAVETCVNFTRDIFIEFSRQQKGKKND